LFKIQLLTIKTKDLLEVIIKITNRKRNLKIELWGSYCHLCGQNDNLTDLKPLCYSCYQ